jgi:hypothetical protein
MTDIYTINLYHYNQSLCVLGCNEGIFCVVLDTSVSQVSTLHLASGVLAVSRSPTPVGTVRTASRRHCVELYVSWKNFTSTSDLPIETQTSQNIKI